jgi:hypothetical protein
MKGLKIIYAYFPVRENASLICYFYYLFKAFLPSITLRFKVNCPIYLFLSMSDIVFDSSSLVNYFSLLYDKFKDANAIGFDEF